jgi:hypothetical protein
MPGQPKMLILMSYGDKQRSFERVLTTVQGMAVTLFVGSTVVLLGIP